MSAPQLSDEEHKRRYDAFLQYGSVKLAAEALGLNKDAISRAKRWAARRGLAGTDPVMDGFKIAKVSNALDESGNVTKSYIQQKPELGEEYDLPECFVRQASTTQVGPDGRKERVWYKDKKGEPEPEEISAIVRKALDGFKGAVNARKKPQILTSTGKFFLPIADTHIGACYKSNDPSLRWGSLDTVADIEHCIEEIVEDAPPCETAILQGLGDICDFDGLTAVTEKSKHVLETDLSYGEMLDLTMDLFHFIVDRMLSKFGKVDMSMVHGNHDQATTHAIKAYIKGVYLKEPRVTVDMSDYKHVMHEFGDYMLFGTHGDEMKFPAIPGFMSSAYEETWGRRKFRLGFCGHTHGQKSEISDKGGVISEVLAAMTRTNRYAKGHGFNSFRGLKGMAFCDGGKIIESKVILK